MDSCTAVGSSVESPTQEHTLAAVWNGRAWQLQATPNPDSAGSNVLSAVSCRGAGHCAAVGWYGAPSGRKRSRSRYGFRTTVVERAPWLRGTEYAFGDSSGLDRGGLLCSVPGRTAGVFAAFDIVSQVHLDRWSAGRVALTGDAAGGDHQTAFARYQQLIQHYAAQGQK